MLASLREGSHVIQAKEPSLPGCELQHIIKAICRKQNIEKRYFSGLVFMFNMLVKIDAVFFHECENLSWWRAPVPAEQT